MVMKKAAAVKPPTFTWDAETPAVLADALKELSKFQPALKGGRGATKLVFKKGKDAARCSVKANADGSCTITYGKPNMALRMVGSLISGIIPEKEEYCPFNMFGIMLDCSRNAVMTTACMKEYFARLALFGYNMIMLYTEDTYEIAGEPFFGFMRGALSRREIKEMDDFCAKLGMEMIPCIQTLGHLGEALQWGCYGGVTDMSGILLVDEPKTYELIEKMMLAWKGTVRSKRIHLGMDETHNIGRGRFYDRHGDENHVNIFNRHISKVMELCKKNGFEPMIWSDMYFRLASKGNDYYDKESVVTQEVIDMIPKGVELVYWDYYHEDKEFYLDWIARHRKMAGEPLMGSGVWTWNLFWYGRDITEATVVPCIEACREAKVKDVFFTMWGDDGGFCDYDSAMAGLGFASELSFTGAVSHDALNKKFDALLDGANYENVIAASDIDPLRTCGGLRATGILWDDPLMLMVSGSHKLRENKQFCAAIERFSAVSKKLARIPKKGSAGDLRLAKAIADAAAAKLIMADALLDAYADKKNAAAEIKKAVAFVDDYEKKFHDFVELFRAMWLRHNKPFGLETMQVRFGGQSARIQELRLRLKDFAAGKTKNIPEFDELKKLKVAVGGWGYIRPSHASTII